MSPDGAVVLGTSWNETARRSMLATLTLKTREIAFLPDFPPNALFLPDGTLTVGQRRNGKTNIVARPIRGGQVRVLGEAGTDNVYAGAVSRDGRLALSRGTSSSDVVLIRAK